MSGTERAACAATVPVPLLFLIADTGGGHRNAARAVCQALDRVYPGSFAPVLCDPLGGRGSARLLRWVVGLYGPAIRLTPWLWGAAYHACNSRPAMALLGRTLLRLADGPAADAAAAHRPAAIVSFHPLTGMAAVSARDQGAHRAPVVTVVTDLATMHAAWRHANVDLIIAPLAAVTGEGRPHGPARGRRVLAGPPVTRDFCGGPLRPRERAILRRSLGLSENGFLVLLTGGGEGSGGIGRRAAAILRRFADVDAVAVCGRNLRLKRRLDRLAARSGGRLTVIGFAPNLADWLRCADLVVTKAGPGTITEAACCGTPLLLTSHVPGQEKGNTEFVTGAGAGRRVASVRRLLAEIGRLRGDRAAVDAMRAASARLGRPGDADVIAELIVGLARARAATGAGPGMATGPGPAAAAPARADSAGLAGSAAGLPGPAVGLPGPAVGLVGSAAGLAGSAAWRAGPVSREGGQEGGRHGPG
jgi:1,2-diacylglycerol 3-beta-galactosyltransferase